MTNEERLERLREELDVAVQNVVTNAERMFRAAGETDTSIPELMAWVRADAERQRIAAIEQARRAIYSGDEDARHAR